MKLFLGTAALKHSLHISHLSQLHLSLLSSYLFPLQTAIWIVAKGWPDRLRANEDLLLLNQFGLFVFVHVCCNNTWWCHRAIVPDVMVLCVLRQFDFLLNLTKKSIHWMHSVCKYLINIIMLMSHIFRNNCLNSKICYAQECLQKYIKCLTNYEDGSFLINKKNVHVIINILDLHVAVAVKTYSYIFILLF